MKTEEQIKNRIEKINILLSEELGISYPKLSKLKIEMDVLKSVLVDEEKPVMPKQINIGGYPNAEERIINLIRKKPKISVREIATELDYTVLYVGSVIKRLVLAKKIVGEGLGKRNHPRRYRIK